MAIAVVAEKVIVAGPEALVPFVRVVPEVAPVPDIQSVAPAAPLV